MSLPLTEKYRPNSFAEVIGQEEAIDKLKNFFNNFTTGKSKRNAILLYGPAGVGKTTLAYALASEFECELFELNASDLRNRQKLDEVMRPSSLQQSLFKKNKILLIDEVDGVTTTDFGGLSELINIIETTKYPIIITANDIWQQKFSSLRPKCELIELKEIPYILILEFLEKLSKKENRMIEPSMIKSIAIKSKGDLRAAINDLHSMMHNLEATYEDLGEREKSENIFEAMKKVFKLKASEEIINVYDNVDLELDKITLWIEKNIPKEYQGKDLAKAFDSLSKADIFKGRIHRQQHWHFLTYQNFFISHGVSAARQFKNPKSFTKYEQPNRILKIWLANKKDEKKNSIAGKYAEMCHISKSRAKKEFNIIVQLIDEKTMKDLDLSEEEREFIDEKKETLKKEIKKALVQA
jgi:replication factor C large subunit